MPTASDRGKSSAKEEQIRVSLTDCEPLPAEGHNLMRSFLAIRSPSARKLIVELMVEMSKFDESTRTAPSGARC